MAMIDPPIEKLIDKAGNRYALVTVISKRAKELLLEKAEFFRENQKIKPIEFASDEFFAGKFDICENGDVE